MPRRDDLFLWEMIDAAEQAIGIATAATVDELRGDRLRRDALLWNFTVLGEAAGQVSDEAKQSHPQVPWSRPTRLRNRIVHGYWSADIEMLHTTAVRDLPGLVADLRRIAADD